MFEADGFFMRKMIAFHPVPESLSDQAAHRSPESFR
jgi:hypothetical protein